MSDEGRHRAGRSGGAPLGDDPGRDQDRAAGEPETPPASVLGNLPHERPGRRSPRREKARTRTAAAGGPGTSRRDDQRADEGGTADPGSGLEDLAWAGIAVAAEAATLGVRLVNRVLGAGTPRQRPER